MGSFSGLGGLGGGAGQAASTNQGMMGQANSGLTNNPGYVTAVSQFNYQRQNDPFFHIYNDFRAGKLTELEFDLYKKEIRRHHSAVLQQEEFFGVYKK